MTNFDKYPILKNHFSTLKEASKDSHDANHIVYMTESKRRAVNFDEVKEEYAKSLFLAEPPKSNDALFLTKDHVLVFVEFKNGSMHNTKPYYLRQKIYDSVIILTDILDTGISHLRDKMEYILVYNESANAEEQDVLKKKQNVVQHSDSYRTIAKNVRKLAKKEFISFGIDFFEKYCFRKVHTYSKEEFEEYLKNN